MTEQIRPILTGRRALVVGIANDQSIAYGCAKAFRMAGAELAVTWLNEKARMHVEPLARELEASIIAPLDVAVPGQLETLFDRIRAEWDRLDILVHSIAFAPKEDLQGGLLNCSAEGFGKTMDISCHSFVRMARLAAPLMTEGGTMFAMSYYGANRVVPNYNVMGPVKAALEAACRYLAFELGPSNIRVHAISPGPLRTRAASGIRDFELLLNQAAQKSPIGELIDIMDVGFACTYPKTNSRGGSPVEQSMSMAGQILSPDRIGASHMENCLGVLNAGSSSIKFAIYDPRCDLQLRFRGQIKAINIAPRLKIADATGHTLAEQGWAAAKLDHAAATLEILRTCQELLRGQRMAAIGHRVVHGGTRFTSPVKIDPAVADMLEALVPLAPLHQPHNLAPIRVIADAAPHIAQVACFDTAFHREQPWVAQAFAIPRELSEAGIHRYGFHGLSYEFVTSRLGRLAPGLAAARVVIAHLGSGASLCGVRGGRSVASTMGFTAVDGLMMGTRCGTIDPGVLLYPMDQKGMDTRAVEDLVYRRSGLLGVSGISSDMHTLRNSADPKAKEAISLFVYRIVREIGSMAAALGGLDALVFTAGIGENDPATRAAVMEGCAWLGLELDPARNAAGAGRISADSSRASAWVVATDEEYMIARHALSVLSAEQSPKA